jgi:cytochrome c-type biogenesis protein CcmE
MTRKQRRATFIVLGVGILGCAVFLVIFALRDYTVGFHSPSEVLERKVPPGKRIRLGGLVANGSLVRGATAQFAITDTVKTIPVSYTGALPDLFREGQGVIAEGTLDADGRFVASSVLAKHDENYMPPEVAKKLPPDALQQFKKTGVWHGGDKAEDSVQK